MVGEPVLMLCGWLQLYGMDYGPDNFDDATTRFSESTPARPMLMNNGEEVTIPPEDTEKLLLIRTPIHAIDSDIVQQVRLCLSLCFAGLCLRP